MAALKVEQTSRQQAFESIYGIWRTQVFRWALTYACGQRSMAEDLTHDVFLRVLEDLVRLPTERELGFWLYRVTANLALSRLRRERSFLTRVSRLLGAGASDADPAPAPDHRLQHQQSANAALRAVRELPAQERVVMTLKLMEGKSQQEICEVLGLSKGYVSKLAARGWERIRAAGWEVEDEAA